MLNPSDAEKAMGTVQAATARARALQGYAAGAPALIVWGLVWLCANLVSWSAPSLGGIAWMIGIAVGIAASIWVGMGEQPRWAWAARRGMVERSVLSAGIIAAMIGALVSLTDMSGQGAVTAGLSLLVAGGFTLAGLWIGPRYLGLGLALTVLIVFGLWLLDDGLELWLGLACGGLLIGFGLWFRRA